MASSDNPSGAAGVDGTPAGARGRAVRPILTGRGAAIRIAGVCAALALSAAVLSGEERIAPKKLKPGVTCTAPACHTKRTVRAVVHKPVAKITCDACHDQDDETLHEFELIDQGSELCYGCHKDETKGKKHVHEPLTDKKKPCLSCHKPHSTATPHLLRAETTSGQCLSCHDEFATGELYHKSRAAKGCIGCHSPHASDFDKLLLAAPRDMCFTCHDDVKEDMAEAKSVHGPLVAGCVGCHDPHRPLTGMGLKKQGAGLCLSCHEHFKSQAVVMSKRHPKLLENNGCRRCHSPHFSARKYQLTKSPQKLCLGCHSKPFKDRAGRELRDVKAQIAEATEVHGPLVTQDCGKCHQPHGNDRFSFLRRSYPGTFYSVYTPQTYALCFGCHDSELAADKHTPMATNFRNGSRNLHYIHVNKPGKGRTCRACHANHGTNNSHMLADSISFGTWKIPVGFKATTNGGTCVTGCHRQMGYDRQVALELTPTTGPASMPAVPAGGKQATTAPASWVAKQ